MEIVRLTARRATPHCVLDDVGRNCRRPCWKAAIPTPRRASAFGCGDRTRCLHHVLPRQVADIGTYYCAVVLSS